MALRRLLSFLLTLVCVSVILLVCINLSGCIGLVYYDPTQTCDGYTLMCKDTTAHLLDMNGIIIKSWNINCYPAKMFPDGSIMGQSGFGEARLELSQIVQYSWDGELEWKFTDWEVIDGVSTARVHHDFQRDGNPVGYYAPGLPPQSDSNVLVLAKDDVLDPEISKNLLMDDVIYEVDWETQESALLWQASDHFGELGFDEQAKQLIYSSGGDYLHINSVSRVGPNKWYDPDTGEGDVRFHPDNLIMDSR
ncbi:MAG: hypothetical protein JW854_15490, partial [Actinobacteria bacterium]|nr:hypothetical protein [Actinomycetota bacterium]